MQTAASQSIFLFGLRAKCLQLPRRKAIYNLGSFRICSPEHSLIQQLYLDRAESCLQALHSNSQAASRKGARGARDSGVCRALGAALGTDGAALRSPAPSPCKATVPLGSGALHTQPDTAASRGGACQPRGAPFLQLTSPCGWAPSPRPAGEALPPPHPSGCARPGWMRLWAAASSGRCPYRRQSWN